MYWRYLCSICMSPQKKDYRNSFRIMTVWIASIFRVCIKTLSFTVHSIKQKMLTRQTNFDFDLGVPCTFDLGILVFFLESSPKLENCWAAVVMATDFLSPKIPLSTIIQSIAGNQGKPSEAWVLSLPQLGRSIVKARLRWLFSLKRPNIQRYLYYSCEQCSKKVKRFRNERFYNIPQHSAIMFCIVLQPRTRPKILFIPRLLDGQV